MEAIVYLINKDLYDFISPVDSLVLVSIEQIYQTLKTVFEHIAKHLKASQECSAARRIFNSLQVRCLEMCSITVLSVSYIT